MRSFFALVALVSSTCAYQVLTPGNVNGWTTAGPNIVTWQRVVTDPQNFTMLLVNQNQGILPGGQEVLAALVNGSALTYTVPSPSGGFPVGSGFQVNFVQDTANFNTIYAQSGQFNITASSSTISPSSTVTSASTSTSATPTTPATVAATTDTSGALNPTGTSTSSGNSADRVAVAGSTALLFAALTVFIL